jgi:DNA (cytosine-5)-methyltransferase 1
MKIRLLELCAGYGSQALALKNLGLEVYSEIAEFDKYASQAYMQLHGETKNYGDIYTIDETKLPYFDMITYSTPCQDFSVAGKGKGGDKGSGTRSSLLWECERIIRAVKPKYLLMENVKNLLSDKHRHNFNEWFKVLEGMGYTNYYKVLNAKDYGIPQNRERIFCVSILGGGQYLFPNPIPLEKRLKDMLEDNVDEKYYLRNKMLNGFIRTNEQQRKVKGGYIFTPTRGEKIAKTITTKAGSRITDNYIQEPLCAASRGRNPDNPSDRTIGSPTEQRLEINYTGCTNTLTSVQKDNYVVENYRIRKLTARECFRLMGVKDEQFDRLHDLSNSQLYKLAGNSIVVDVLEHIFRNLLMPETTDTKGQLNLF